VLARDDVGNPDKALVLVCKTKEQRAAWVSALSDCIAQLDGMPIAGSDL